MPDRPPADAGGYEYEISDEAIEKYMQWSIATRLTWLEEANRFLHEALPPRARKIREAFRRGTLD